MMIEANAEREREKEREGEERGREIARAEGAKSWRGEEGGGRAEGAKQTKYLCLLPKCSRGER